MDHIELIVESLSDKENTIKKKISFLQDKLKKVEELKNKALNGDINAKTNNNR